MIFMGVVFHVKDVARFINLIIMFISAVLVGP